MSFPRVPWILAYDPGFFLLNTVFLLSCLPVVTIGASLIALNAGIEGVLHDEYSLKNYWKTWMRALKIGFVLELVVLACTGLIALCVVGLAYLHAPALVAMPFLVIFALELLVLPFTEERHCHRFD